ncbi:MAG: hypothetical protein ABIR54_03285 [Burkholderiaceae bacterium]|jgi:hypothetical protein
MAAYPKVAALTALLMRDADCAASLGKFRKQLRDAENLALK